MKFADFFEGQLLECGPETLTEAQILDFARDYDPQWFHTDKSRATHGRWGGLIASGWQTCGIAMRMVARDILADSESFASPGLNYVKWPAPVRPGDHLRLSAHVIELCHSSTGRVGSLRWQWSLFNQDKNQILELEAISLFDLSGNYPS